jgi:adenine phosphoribosyltransferase
MRGNRSLSPRRLGCQGVVFPTSLARRCSYQEEPKSVVDRFIRDVPDFPKPGIVFKDITPLLQSPEGLKESIDGLVDPSTYDVVCGIESRGFIFGTALALQLGKGFIPIRKPGKLPYTTVSETYDLEYGSDEVHIHTDATAKGKRFLMLDDLLATGGTMGAALNLVRKVGAEPVACVFVIELGFLPGREKLGDVPSFSLVKY